MAVGLAAMGVIIPRRAEGQGEILQSRSDASTPGKPPQARGGQGPIFWRSGQQFAKVLSKNLVNDAAGSSVHAPDGPAFA